MLSAEVTSGLKVTTDLANGLVCSASRAVEERAVRILGQERSQCHRGNSCHEYRSVMELSPRYPPQIGARQFSPGNEYVCGPFDSHCLLRKSCECDWWTLSFPYFLVFIPVSQGFHLNRQSHAK